jgi:hypothetical protein
MSQTSLWSSRENVGHSNDEHVAWDFQYSIDEEDVATLEPWREVLEKDVLEMVLPPGQHLGQRCLRCCRKDTFQKFFEGGLHVRWAHQFGAETLPFTSTPFVGVDMLVSDVDLILRYISEGNGDLPLVLKIAEVRRINSSDVRDPLEGRHQDHRQQAAVNLHVLVEGLCEQALWKALDTTMINLTRGKCPQGHQLRILANPPVPWVCDGCESHFTRLAKPHRCQHNCDFDLCNDCAGLADSSLTDQAILEAFEQLLERLRVEASCFAAAASMHDQSKSAASLVWPIMTGYRYGMLKLPALCPRDFSWDPSQRGYVLRKLSSRISKWNTFRLDESIARELQRLFLFKALFVEPFFPDEQHLATLQTVFRPGGGEVMSSASRPPLKLGRCSSRFGYILRALAAMLLGYMLVESGKYVCFRVAGFWDQQKNSTL